MRRLPPLAQPASSRQKLVNWLMMVAQAAPATPISRVKIKSGSSPMFKMAPLVMPTMA